MEDEKKTYVTNKELQLELKALRADFASGIEKVTSNFRLWLIGAVALNNFLAGVQVPSVVAGSVVLGLVAKGVVAWFAKT